jgi:hypothetical protein
MEVVRMGPKFDDPLYFQSDGALEVCGPTNFGPNDISFELLKVTVVDKNGVERHTPHLSIFFRAGEMWETDIEHARDLAAGRARGVGRGRATKRDGSTKIIEWAGRFELIDPTTFLETSDGD